MLAVSLCTVLATPINSAESSAFKTVGYLPVNGAMADMNEIDFTKMTHVIGSFIFSKADGTLHFPGWKYDPSKTAEAAEEEMLDTMIVRAKRAGIVPMIALGTTSAGWEMTKSATARTNFVKNTKALMIKKGIGGIDLDLEGWVGDASSPFYPQEYALLAKELRDSLGTSFLLSSAVSANLPHVPNWTDDLLNTLDWVNVMVYDIRVWGEGDIRNQSLFEDQTASAKYWSDRGLKKSQIVFGVPAYSRGWDYDRKKPYAVDVCWSPNGTDSTKWTWGEMGTFSYEMLRKKFTLNDDQDSVLVTPTDKMWIEDGWTGYRKTANGVLYFNGPSTLAKKTQWAIDSGYGGMMMWELTGDIETSHSKSVLGTIAKTIAASGTTSTGSPQMRNVAGFSWSVTSQNVVISNPFVGESKLSIFDLRGRVVYQMTANSLRSSEISLSKNELSLTSGVYLLSLVNSASAQMRTAKVNIQ